MTWIPVTERLPDNCRDVLVYLNWGSMTVAYFGPLTQRWKNSESDRIVGVTHWMELPAAPGAT